MNLNFTFPKSVKIDRFFERGRLWIDAVNAQIWREENQVMAQPAGTAQPQLLLQIDIEYAPSAFDIPVPRRIIGSSYLRLSGTKSNPKTTMISRVTAQYGAFQRFGAEVRIVP